ncbi:MAG: hypothetical protein ACT4QG_09345 [Sporichthyaceae bacterium]
MSEPYIPKQRNELYSRGPATMTVVVPDGVVVSEYDIDLLWSAILGTQCPCPCTGPHAHTMPFSAFYEVDEDHPDFEDWAAQQSSTTLPR